MTLTTAHKHLSALALALMIAAAVILLWRAADASCAPAFTATELLGRPTATSVTVNVVPASAAELYVEYGTVSGVYTGQTTVTTAAAGVPAELTLSSLSPDTRYYYRVRYRSPGETFFGTRPEYGFRTQRPPGSTFTFTAQSDPHLYDGKCDPALYTIAMQNQLADSPDFMFDLGDTFGDDHAPLPDAAGMDQLHLDERPYFGIVGASAPLFLALGNHEAEGGYYLPLTPPNNVAIYGTLARLKYYPNPTPDGFYTGNQTVEPYVGLPENYYAFQWGDALFVVLDAYRGCTTDPKVSLDMWDWTLGRTQYDWFKATLEGSHARYKFVFIHHVLGQTRGGVSQARLGEWGGENKDGTDGWATHRAGWAKPIHDLMVDTGVTIFFQGHDHVYAKESLDGVVYQALPMPSDATYHVGDVNADAFAVGSTVNDSGHLRVTVAPSGVTVDYVRAYLPGDGANREVSASYTVTSPVPVDTTAPGPVGSLSVTGGLLGADLSWTNPTDADFDHVQVVRSSGSDPTGPDDGVVVYRGSGTSVTDAAPVGANYHYGIWTYDRTGNRSPASLGSAAVGDFAAPVTTDDAPSGWRHHDVVVTLSPVDDGSGMSGGAAKTEYSTDGGATWLSGLTVGIAAPLDHSGDGPHVIAYRSTDAAGNAEADKSCEVRIDTRRPVTRAPYRARVARGAYVRLRYRVNDLAPNGGTAKVTIRIKTLGGRTVKTMAFAAAKPVNTLLSWRFRCVLAKRTYRFWVYASDTALNTQSYVGRNLLVVH